MSTAKIELSYLALAREAHERGDRPAKFRALIQHRRVHRKKRALVLLEQTKTL